MDNIILNIKDKFKNLKNEKRKYINIFIFILFLIIYLFTLEVFGMGHIFSRSRYFLLGMAVVIGFLSLIEKNKDGKYKIRKNLQGTELLLSIVTSILFLIVSMIKAYSEGQELNSRTYVQISLILLPALYAFCFTNIFSMRTIIKIMQIMLIILVFTYFMEAEHNITNFFILDNWKEISFTKSTSFTESNICAEPFLQLFLFFTYFKYADIDIREKKRNKICAIIAFIFTLLSFKRLGVVFAIMILIGEKLIDYRTKVSNKFSIILTILFTISTVCYTKFMQGDIFENLDVFKLTSGRNWILSLWENRGYLSLGYGSSLIIIGRYLELDLIQIYLELNIFCLFIFCYTFFKIARKSMYVYIIIGYAFLNMLTASSLPYSLGWIILLINSACIASEKCDIENIEFSISKQTIKKIFHKENVVSENDKISEHID